MYKNDTIIIPVPVFTLFKWMDEHFLLSEYLMFVVFKAPCNLLLILTAQILVSFTFFIVIAVVKQ